jgi:hypothetical protein
MNQNEMLEQLINKLRDKFTQSEINIAAATTLTDLLFEDTQKIASDIYETLILSVTGRTHNNDAGVVLYPSDIIKIQQLFMVAKSLNEIN